MTRLQKLQLRQSEVRVSLGTLLDTPETERTDTYADDLSKLTTEVTIVGNGRRGGHASR